MAKDLMDFIGNLYELYREGDITLSLYRACIERELEDSTLDKEFIRLIRQNYIYSIKE